MATRILLIGLPGSRRVQAFAEAAVRMGHGPVDVVSWLDLIAGRQPPPAADCLVRLNSPGECAATNRAILKAGIVPMQESRSMPLFEADIDHLACDRGEMLHPRQWFYGFRAILAALAVAWQERGIRWMSTPLSVIKAFDKRDCLETWSAAGLPVPERFSGITSYSQLREAVFERHARLFVNLRYGYSAMGAVAVEWRGALIRAITTMDVTWSAGRPRLFVTKRPRVLHREFEIAWLIDTLGMEEILVEEWIPKARWEGQPYDLRAVMIDGKMHHLVGRANSSPFTNLNLGASRISRRDVEQHLGDSWSVLNSLCEQAASCLSEAGVLGLDVLVKPCRRKFALLEANAFGDYLPGLFHRGRSTYESQLSASRWQTAKATA